MKPTHHIRQFAKELLGLSLTNGRPDADKVGAVLASLEKNPPRHLPAILREYQRLVRREVERHTAILEHAGPVDPALRSSLLSSLEGLYGRTLDLVLVPNPRLIAGLRVRVDSDLYDLSLQGRLSLLLSNSSQAPA